MKIAIILSGGNGTRMGGEVPKQYQIINGRPLIDYCLKTILNHKEIDYIQIVAEENWRDFITTLMNKKGKNKFLGYSNPGETRQMSILNALKDIRKETSEDTIVMIHDAARPCLESKQITECMHALKGHEGVLPVLYMKDTVYFSQDSKTIKGLLDRNCVFAGQAPEIFYFQKYYQANLDLLPEKILKINGSSEPAVLAGMDIVMIPGDEKNYKITTREDLQNFIKQISGGY